MGIQGKGPLPKEVEHLQRKVQEWRQVRAGSEPTPGAIWDAAAALAAEFGVCRIARAVGLDYSWLRKKVAAANHPGPARAVFVELPRGLMVPQVPAPMGQSQADSNWALGPGPVINLATPDGTRLRICLEAGQAVDAAGIVAAFLGRSL